MMGKIVALSLSLSPLTLVRFQIRWIKREKAEMTQERSTSSSMRTKRWGSGTKEEINESIKEKQKKKVRLSLGFDGHKTRRERERERVQSIHLTPYIIWSPCLNCPSPQTFSHFLIPSVQNTSRKSPLLTFTHSKSHLSLMIIMILKETLPQFYPPNDEEG